MTPLVGAGLQGIIPDGWVDRSTVTLVGPASGGFAANIVVTREPVAPGSTPAAYGRAELESLIQGFDDLSVDHEETTELRGRTVFRRVQSFQMHGRWLRQLQIYMVLVRPGQQWEALIITATASRESFDAHEGDFERFAEALEFLESSATA